MSSNNSSDWTGFVLMLSGVSTASIGLNTVEQILRIILLIVSIASFAAATILYKKKIKKIEDAIKEELKKKCPPDDLNKE